MLSFLPIVQRELRVASRRRSTFRARWWTAFLAMAISFVSLAFLSLGSATGAGELLFNIFTGYAFGLCLLAGVLLTADSLAEEKRDGTLGLLFLTDLKGYDVVLGKFAASSLTAFFCLAALLPMTAVPMLVGGVTGSDFWRMALALINALFFSLAAGMCVSALSRDSQRALGNGLGLVLVIVAGLPLLAKFTPQGQWAKVWQTLSWVSPLYPFSYATDVITPDQARIFWRAFAASNSLGWCLLAVASLALPRSVRAQGTGAGARHPWLRQASGRWRSRARSERQSLSQHPVAWLVGGDLGIQWGAWVVVAAWAVMVFSALLWLPGQAESLYLHPSVMAPFGFCLKVLFALQACRFFAEGRRNGALELLLCTPLTNRDILGGQVRALWRAFLWPVVTFVAVSFAPVGVFLVRAVTEGELSPVAEAASTIFSSGIISVRLIVDLVAVCWFGMGMALTMKRPSLAPPVTIIAVLILPSVLCWLDLIPSFIFIAVGISKCQRDLRRLLAEQYLGPVAATRHGW